MKMNTAQSRSCYMLFVATVLFLLQGIFCTGGFVGFSPLTILDGESCPQSHMIDDTIVDNEKKCFILCSRKPSCYGVFLGPYERCVTCAAKFFTKDDTQHTSAVTRFYKRLPDSSAYDGITSGVSVFHVVTQRLYWVTSKQSCEGLGGYLASIKSEEENEYVVNTVLASFNGNIWIGGNGTNESPDTFKWLDGSKVADGYTNWISGQPFHPVEETVCMLMFEHKNYQWGDNFCNTVYYGLCQFE
ncbi:uncharacterized protein LOC123530900 [Mercenaria mercenaria]|uniref:uncharacterized protein LOC123530900 n=1 Tax=Mercenaria mercenaria TaxID=6596 RepID=UPI00234E3A00|nr:uncharacterized protein LOC123530900 [Mercenaria mercenaria]